MKAPCSHPELNEKLLLYCEGTVAPAVHRAIDQHLRECAVCSQDLSDLKEILPAVKAHAAVLSAVECRSDCPAPGTLVEYVEHRQTLTAADAASIASHLPSCPACTREVAYLTMLQSAPVQQPDFIEMTHREKEFLSMVSRQVPPTAHSASGLLRWLSAALNSFKERIQSLASGVSAAQPQPVYVRKAPRKAGENVSVVRDTSRGLAVRIEIESIDPGTVDLMVFVAAPKNKRLLAGMRASLFHEGTERSSFILSQGKAVFRKLPHATYELCFSREGTEVKRIQFNTR